jgi:hypothetical protein
MFAYWALFGIFGVAAATTDERKRRLGIVSWLIAGILLIVMIGLRRNVGADWRAYQAIFDRLSYLGFSGVVDTVDPSYKLLNLLAASLGFGVWAILMFQSWLQEQNRPVSDARPLAGALEPLA